MWPHDQRVGVCLWKPPEPWKPPSSEARLPPFFAKRAGQGRVSHRFHRPSSLLGLAPADSFVADAEDRTREVQHMKPMAIDAPTMRECSEPDDTSAGQLWHIRDVARYLRLPVSSVYKMTGPKASYRIPHLRLRGRLLRFRKSDIDRWLDLMSVSNLDAIDKLRARVLRGADGHGHNSRKEAA